MVIDLKGEVKGGGRGEIDSRIDGEGENEQEVREEFLGEKLTRSEEPLRQSTF